MQFLKILFWETLENIPLFMGFLLAVRWQVNSWPLALFCLAIGIVLGVGAIHLTETKKFSNQPSLRETVTNGVVFMALALPFVFYFSGGNVWWSNWVTDILLGLVLGALLAFGESRGWSGTATLKTHTLAMAIAATLLLLGIRFIYQAEPLVLMLLAGGVLTILVSALIVWIDYWPVKLTAHLPTESNL